MDTVMPNHIRLYRIGADGSPGSPRYAFTAAGRQRVALPGRRSRRLAMTCAASGDVHPKRVVHPPSLPLQPTGSITPRRPRPLTKVFVRLLHSSATPESAHKGANVWADGERLDLGPIGDWMVGAGACLAGPLMTRWPRTRPPRHRRAHRCRRTEAVRRSENPSATPARPQQDLKGCGPPLGEFAVRRRGWCGGPNLSCR